MSNRPWKRFRRGYGNRRTGNNGNNHRRNANENDNDNGEDGVDEDSQGSPDNNDGNLNVFAVKDENSDDSSTTHFYGYKLYFNDDDKKNSLFFIQKIKAAQKFFQLNPHNIPATYFNKDSPAFNVNVNWLYDDNEFIDNWGDDFKYDLYNNPEETLNYLSFALYQVVINNSANAADDCSGNIPGDSPKNLKMLRVKIFNYRPLTTSSNIKFNLYGKLIATRGCVIRVGRSKELAQWFVFSCVHCKTNTVVKQTNGIYTLPKKSCKRCKKCKSEPKLSSPYTVSVPFQVIKLQEHLDALLDASSAVVAAGESSVRGKMPRILEVELFDDLVDTCGPGDDITVVGIIKVRGTDDGVPKTGGGGNSSRATKETCMSNALYIEAVSIVNNKNKSQQKNAAGLQELNTSDLLAIKKIRNCGDEIFPLLIRSLCPTIYGHEMIKAGLLLSLFGGTSNTTDGREAESSSRDNIHVLIVGDPGLGKSQMLCACSKIAPQGVYVCGNASTSSGLTVTLTKESGTTDFALEPGALVLANNGSCIIDEFDKMPTQHQALLEAMEQQSVSVAKSGIICSLQAKTSILAAANPIGGRYNLAKTVIDNLNLSQPLLSRFDLIFLLLDKPNQQKDSMMCAHVMNTHHQGFQRIQKRHKQDLSTDMNCSVKDTPDNSTKNVNKLSEKLKSYSNHEEVVPQIILRKYIAYARQYVKPKLTPEAAAILKQFYLQLRGRTNLFDDGSFIPVFNRQLEALIRLTQARAKLELRNKIYEKDALDVVELFKYMIATVPEASGMPIELNTSRADNGKITANKVRAYMKLLKNEAKNGTTEFSSMELNELAIMGSIVIDNFNRFIRKLNEEGIILKRGKDNYEFVGDD